jgi:hypothetical protein
MPSASGGVGNTARQDRDSQGDENTAAIRLRSLAVSGSRNTGLPKNRVERDQAADDIAPRRSDSRCHAELSSAPVPLRIKRDRSRTDRQFWRVDPPE